MAKDRICTGCKFNNNGWCKVKKTNQGLRDLLSCSDREPEDDALEVPSLAIKSSDGLETFIAQKEIELKVANTSYNRGVIDGLKIALAMQSK